MAALTGLLCGLADTVAVQLPLFSTDRVIFVPPRIWLLIPLVWAGYLVFVALLALAARMERWLPFLLTLAGPGLLGVTKVAVATRFLAPGKLIVIPLSLWTIAVVAVAAFVHRRARASHHPQRSMRLLGVTIAVLVLCGVLVIAQRDRTASAPRGKGRPGSPDVVVIFLDTVREDAMADAPALRRFAAEGRYYTNAWSPYPWTLPSHLSMVTGYGPTTLDIDFDHQRYRGSRPTLAELFHRNGYETRAIFANPYLNPVTGMSRGFDTFEYSETDLDLCRTTFGFIVKAIPNARVPVCRMTADDITRHAQRAIAHRTRPLFLAVNYFDAHLPYWVPADRRPDGYRPFQPLVEYPLVDAALRRMTTVPPAIVDRLHHNYRISMHYLDDALARLLKTIQTDPQNTIVVVVGDHAEQFGEHGLTMHANSVYRQVLHVPLIVHGPGIAPSTFTQDVSATDVYGTVLAAAGLAGPRNARALPVTSGEEAPVFSLYRAPRHSDGLPPRLARDGWSIVSGHFHFIRYSDHTSELYDLRNDPEETRNLANDAGSAATLRRLSIMLAPAEATRPGPDDEGKRNLFSVGYLQ